VGKRPESELRVCEDAYGSVEWGAAEDEPSRSGSWLDEWIPGGACIEHAELWGAADEAPSERDPISRDPISRDPELRRAAPLLDPASCVSTCMSRPTLCSICWLYSRISD
jgi:hypothetical protein